MVFCVTSIDVNKEAPKFRFIKLTLFVTSINVSVVLEHLKSVKLTQLSIKIESIPKFVKISTFFNCVLLLRFNIG